jgi:hypothetical protein
VEKENVKPMVNSKKLIESIKVGSGLESIKENAMYKVNVTEIKQLI